jgi:molecular chaperone DnaJ
MKHHPDRNQGDGAKKAEEKFKEAKEAYEMLSDAQKRAAYDQFGHAGVDPNMGAAAAPGPRASAALPRPSATSSATSSAAAAAGPRRRRPAGLPRQRPQLRDGDLARGGRGGKDTQIRIPSWDSCDTCNGTGAKPGTSAKTCPTCNGSGTVHLRQGFFSIQQTCPHCRGSGKIIPEPCTTCNGAGKIKRQKTLEVKIPAGINEGMRIRSAGNGEPGTNGGPPGDLYIEIRIKPHEIFERDGDDLHCTVPVGLTTAALGGTSRCPRWAARPRSNCPKARSTARPSACAARASRASAPATRATCTATSRVETPVKLTEHQRKLLKELDESLPQGRRQSCRIRPTPRAGPTA